ncbi:hypothetical protein BOX15_Mlig008253g1, partial [Macrostomum lignano]
SQSRAVLQAYKALHRAAQVTFAGDSYALGIVGDRIRTGFREQAALTDPAAVAKQLLIARDCAAMLRTHVVRATRESEGDAFRVQLGEDTYLEDSPTPSATPATEAPSVGGCGGAASSR